MKDVCAVIRPAPVPDGRDSIFFRNRVRVVDETFEIRRAKIEQTILLSLLIHQRAHIMHELIERIFDGSSHSLPPVGYSSLESYNEIAALPIREPLSLMYILTHYGMLDADIMHSMTFRGN